MKPIAFSNIAWDLLDDELVGALLVQNGFSAVELATSKYWKEPVLSTKRDRQLLRERWEGRGLPVIALQSLLFTQPELGLFKSAQSRSEMFEYLVKYAELADDLGASVMVFGSPRQRLRGDLSLQEARQIATEFFRRLGQRIEGLKCKVGIEGNAKAYGCDFLTTVAEVDELVSDVDHPAIGLHLDYGNMIMEGEDVLSSIQKITNRPVHFHLSAVELKPVDSKLRREFFSLVETYVDCSVSIEMRPAADRQTSLDNIRRCLEK